MNKVGIYFLELETSGACPQCYRQPDILAAVMAAGIAIGRLVSPMIKFFSVQGGGGSRSELEKGDITGVSPWEIHKR